METLAPPDTLAAQMTWDPFCAQEGMQTLQSAEHFDHLSRIIPDLRLHLAESGLSYTLTHDLLIQNIPLKEGVAPDVALWPGPRAQLGAKCGSLELSADWCPALILEVVSENTSDADADTKHEIYRLAGVAEYWLYDPDAYASSEPLCGWQLEAGEYVPIPGREHAVHGGSVTLYASAVLETAWGLAPDRELRLWDPQRNDWYETTPKAFQQERTRADQAEARTQQERTRADQERIRADQAEARLQQERDRTQQQERLLQQEIERLHALLQEHAARD